MFSCTFETGQAETCSGGITDHIALLRFHWKIGSCSKFCAQGEPFLLRQDKQKKWVSSKELILTNECKHFSVSKYMLFKR